jgi:hypothetical protein
MKVILDILAISEYANIDISIKVASQCVLFVYCQPESRYLSDLINFYDDNQKQDNKNTLLFLIKKVVCILLDVC